MSTLHVSVIIPTKDRPDLIGASVRGVLANRYPSFDVTVIDQSGDGRTGDVVGALAAADPRLRYVHTLPPGLSRAYNIGISRTEAPLLAFTDDDCVAAPDWIGRIATAFAEEPDAEMLYGQVLLPASLTGTAFEVPTLRIDRPRRVSRADGFRLYGMGANFAARRSLFERVGLFDEVLGGGAPLRSSQDFDLQYRVYLGGAVVLLRPDVCVDHYGARTPEQWPATERAYGMGDGAFYFKHVRCGDPFALTLLVRRVARLAASEALSAIGVRRRTSQRVYLRAYLEGIRESLRFPVDRQRRLYALPAAAAGAAR